MAQYRKEQGAIANAARSDKIKKEIVYKEAKNNAEKDLQKQKDSSLRKGINSLEKVIEKHEIKVKNPELYTEGWEKFSKRKQEGLIKHWKKEIRTAKERIRRREGELWKRTK